MSSEVHDMIKRYLADVRQRRSIYDCAVAVSDGGNTVEVVSGAPVPPLRPLVIPEAQVQALIKKLRNS